MREASLSITDACITKFGVSQNGYQGGDHSHGSFVEIEITDEGSTVLQATIQREEENKRLVQDCKSVRLIVRGDAERRNLIKGLEFILKELKVLENTPATV